MSVPVGIITLKRPDWGLKKQTVTSVVANDGGGRPDVLCAQMLCGVAFSGLRVLVLLPGGRGEDPVWQAVGRFLGGNDKKVAAELLSKVPMVMYASGTGREFADRADLVYASGLKATEMRNLMNITDAPILTLADLEDEVTVRFAHDVIRVGGDSIAVDGEGFEFPVVYDPSGPVYRPA